MQVFTQVAQLKTFLSEKKYGQGNSIGFVPTMGALHEGHLSLIKESKEKADITVASIFVNPTQFNDPKDFEKYPITIDQDKTLLEKAECDVLFLPSVDEVYPKENRIVFSFKGLDNVMEGEFREGHFSGVALVVSKLFHFVQPDYAFFGQKDLQQFAVINQLVQDLSFPIELVRCNIVRDNHGLALSSRNARLTPEGIQSAQKLNLFLKEVIEEVKENQSFGVVKSLISAFKQGNKDIDLEYLKIVDAYTLEDVHHYSNNQEKAICIASYVESVRLIDNMLFQ